MCGPSKSSEFCSFLPSFNLGSFNQAYLILWIIICKIFLFSHSVTYHAAQNNLQLPCNIENMDSQNNKPNNTTNINAEQRITLTWKTIALRIFFSKSRPEFFKWRRSNEGERECLLSCYLGSGDWEYLFGSCGWLCGFRDRKEHCCKLCSWICARMPEASVSSLWLRGGSYWQGISLLPASCLWK